MKIIDIVIQYMRNNVDKIAHFGISCFLVILLSVLGTLFPNQEIKECIVGGAEITIVFGLIKELYDLFISKEDTNQSLYDLGFDILGSISTAFLLFLLVDNL